jgi:hypothetical protein
MEFVLIFHSTNNKAKAAAEIQYISKSVAPVIAVLKCIVKVERKAIR